MGVSPKIKIINIKIINIKIINFLKTKI